MKNLILSEIKSVTWFITWRLFSGSTPTTMNLPSNVSRLWAAERSHKRSAALVAEVVKWRRVKKDPRKRAKLHIQGRDKRPWKESILILPNSLILLSN